MTTRTRAGLTILTAALVAATACRGDDETAPRVRVSETAAAAEPGPAPSTALPLVTVYKSPTCGCCARWVEHLRGAGFEVRVIDDDDRLLDAKRRHAIGPGHTSCHTAEVGEYFVEGHVPAADIERLLARGPADVRGLAVPGMPMGSPGMEGPRKDDYDVVAIEESGETRVYASH